MDFEFWKDGSGSLLWDDLLAGLEPEDDRKDALEGFKMADRNGDGKVSKDEFVMLMSKSLDCNFFWHRDISSHFFCMNLVVKSEKNSCALP